MARDRRSQRGYIFRGLCSCRFPVYYSNAIASELGGYVHIFHMNNRKVIHSYNVKNRTVSLSSLPSPLLPTSLVSLWDSSLQRDHGDIKRRAINPEEEEEEEEDKKTEIVARSVSDDKLVSNKSWIEPYNENNESPLLKFPLHVLKMIMEFCVGIEYLKFRATCKHCQLAAPMIRWSKNETTLEKLQTYSLTSSPWLMVFDKHQGIITFTDPFFGDKYFIKTPPDDLIGDMQIHYSSFGWLLIRKYPDGTLMFFNPFTSDIRYLPRVPCLESYCFSAPPTSPNCMVVGFGNTLQQNVYIHFVARESNWRVIHLNLDAPSFRFPTFYGQGLYALCDEDGGLDSFVDVDNEEDYTWRHLIAESPISNRCGCSSKQSFLTKCDKHLLLVVVHELGESIQVFKLNDYNTEWEKIDSLGRYAVYICGATCFCIEAKTPEMENKIYFPRLRDEKLVLYSLETRKYHTIDKNVQEISFGDFLETEHHLNLHAWIEPSWILF